MLMESPPPACPAEGKRRPPPHRRPCDWEAEGIPRTVTHDEHAHASKHAHATSTYTHAHARTHAHTHARTHERTHAHARTHTHTHAPTHTHTQEYRKGIPCIVVANKIDLDPKARRPMKRCGSA